MGSFAWKLALAARVVSLGAFGLGANDCEFDREKSLGSVRLGYRLLSPVWQLSLGINRLNIFVWERGRSGLPLRNVR